MTAMAERGSEDVVGSSAIPCCLAENRFGEADNASEAVTVSYVLKTVSKHCVWNYCVEHSVCAQRIRIKFK